MEDEARLAPDPHASRAAGREERRRIRRWRIARRQDVAIGLIVGIIAIIVLPGVALGAIIAALVLIVAGISLLAERRRSRRQPTRRSRGRRRSSAR